jgi:hypothetical protein
MNCREIIFDQLSGIFGSDEYKVQLLEHYDSKNYTPKDKAKLAAEDRFLSDEHLTILAKMYAKQLNKACDLNIQIQPEKNSDVIFSVQWLEVPEGEEVVQVTLRNRWNVHWESVIRVLDDQDISVDGKALEDSSATEPPAPGEPAVKPTLSGDFEILAPSAVGAQAQAEAEAGAEAADPMLASFRDHMGKEINSKTNLVELSIPKKNAPEWNKVANGTPHSCQLVASSEVFNKDNMPLSKDLVPHLDEGDLYNIRSANLLMRFGSLELNPWLEVQMVIYRPVEKGKSDTLHKSSLRFHFGRLLLPSVSGSTKPYTTVEGISHLHFDLSEQKDRYLLSFEYGYAVPRNQGIVDSRMTESEKSLAQRLQDLIMPPKRQRITFVVLLSPSEVKEGSDGEFHRFLTTVLKRGFPGLTRLPYEPYLKKTGFVRLQANNLKTRKDVLLAGSPNMPVKASTEFADLIEAEVQLGFHTDM